MNHYLSKIAKEQRTDHSWVIPAAVSTIPSVAYGITRHGELDLRGKFSDSEKDKLLNKALQKRNLKTTAILAGVTVGATGAAELARRHFLNQQKDEQTKDIKKVVTDVVKKASLEKEAFAETEVKDPNHHNWKPAVVGGALDIPAGIAIGAAGGYLAHKAKLGNLLKKVPIKALHTGEAANHLGTGLISGVTTAGVMDWMQRKEEKKVREAMGNKYLDKVASLMKEAEEQEGMSTGAKIGLGLAAAGGVAGGAYLLRKRLASMKPGAVTQSGTKVKVNPTETVGKGELIKKKPKQRGYSEVKKNPTPHNPQTFDHVP